MSVLNIYYHLNILCKRGPRAPPPSGQRYYHVFYLSNLDESGFNSSTVPNTEHDIKCDYKQ